MFQDYRDAMQKLGEGIELRDLSKKTRKNYISMVGAFLRFCNKPVSSGMMKVRRCPVWTDM